MLFMMIASALAASAPLAEGPRPNVVLIVADDLGWADLGSYGSTFHRTPRLDALAARGRRFTQAYAACPVCSPTRAALMTGKAPARVGLTDWLPGRTDRPDQKLLRPGLRQELPLEEVTLAESLQAAGYATGIIGKWHLGGEGFGPTAQGFDTNVAGDATGTPKSYLAPFGRDGRMMTGLEVAPDGEYLTDRLGVEAERWLDAHRDRPFFLYLPHFAVHTPMVAPADLVATYPEWDGTPHGKQENPTYAAMLEALDRAVGRVVDRIEALGLTEKTLILFTSDNGGLATREGPKTPATINSPLREGKGWVYEGGIRVPLIACWPGRIAPGTDDTPAWSPDLPATIRVVCGLPPDAADGQSLAARLTEGSPVPPRPLFWHYPHYSNQGGRPSGAVRDGDWKLVESYESGRRELFHLGRDPRESTNLADREPETVTRLAGMLASWRQEVGALMPRPNPNYRPNPQAADGSITLPARTAEVTGLMLRYEPLPHKDTLGFWVRPDDAAAWDFEVSTPGTFDVTALVGCGPRSGGSLVEFRMGDQALRLTVPETGGFQAFRPQDLGRLTIGTPGRHTLEVKALTKPGPAVMDLRQVTLTPVRADP